MHGARFGNENHILPILLDGEVVETIDAGTTATTIKGVESGRRYEVSIRAVDEQGTTSPAGEPVTVVTNGDTTPGNLLAYGHVDPVDPSVQECVTCSVVGTSNDGQLRYGVNVFALVATVSNVNSSGAGLDFQWDFGDGATAVGRLATHRYSEPGHYTVSLTASNEGGWTTTHRIQITVS